ncbi:MAG: NTP transferase domain-containing protein [Deltaproteobacteria bacterium]|nr:NTP transferase domain-containing protein [Deltaproteobacteria bacterium]
MQLPNTAIVLAGGLGSRLAPLTAVIPKPLVPIEREAIAEILLRQLRYRGIEKVIVSIGYLGHLIQAVLGDGERFGLRIEYQREEQPLGTVGPLALLADRLPEDFLVLNGDVLSDIDFGALLANHRASGRTLTVATYPKPVKVDLGVLEMGGDGCVTRFVEKPTYDFRVSMGVYAMNRRVLGYFEPGQRFGFDNLVLAMLAKGDPVGTFDWGHGRWLDIGRPSDYAVAQERFAAERAFYLPGEAVEAADIGGES